MQGITECAPEQFGERLNPLMAATPPLAGLYVRGDVPTLKGPVVAIVGARACSTYGAEVARTFGRELAAQGITVVSGLARGIDGEAHRGALEVGGHTLAVLGCGIDRIYPAAHTQLAEEIVATGGAILSEYKPGIDPAPWRFPARSRIVAALADVVVVVEAREGSGALITADFAMKFGRTVMAVPGEITSALAAGSNGLYRVGAKVATSSADVRDALPLPLLTALVTR